MDKALEMLIALLGTLAIIGLTFILVAGFSDGGIFHGKYIKKSKGQHSCNYPIGGETGDQWQCRRCDRIWTYGEWSWK